MIYLKQKTLAGNVIFDRFADDEMFAATIALVKMRKQFPNLKHTFFLIKERAGK